jgi:hypothetical protein
MSLVWNAHLVRDLAPAPRDCPDGTIGERVPEDWCRLCWRDHFVWRDGVWMLEHLGSFDECLHDCHEGSTFLESSS